MLNKIYSVNNFSIDLSVVYIVNLDTNKIQFTNNAGHTQIIKFDSSREVTVKEYDALMRWIALNNRVEHNDQYVLVVDAINSNTTKEKFDSLLATAITEIAKIDAKDAKEREIREARRLKTLAAAEKKRIKKEKEEEKLMKEKQQAELEQGLSAISNEIGAAITLDDIKALIKTKS